MVSTWHFLEAEILRANSATKLPSLVKEVAAFPQLHLESLPFYLQPLEAVTFLPSQVHGLQQQAESATALAGDFPISRIIKHIFLCLFKNYKFLGNFLHSASTASARCLTGGKCTRLECSTSKEIRLLIWINSHDNDTRDNLECENKIDKRYRFSFVCLRLEKGRGLHYSR